MMLAGINHTSVRINVYIRLVVKEVGLQEEKIMLMK